MPPTRRVARRIGWVFWPVAVLVSVGLVGQASYAAFSAKVSNNGNSFGVGTVALSDDDSGSALFNVSNLKPGSTGSRCVAVTSSGSLPSSVKLYTGSASTTNSLATYITLTITQGTGASFGSCTGFTALSSGSAVYSGTLASLTSAATGYSNGVGTWTPSGSSNETRSYQFAYTVSSSTPDSVQGGTAALSFTWETQNT